MAIPAHESIAEVVGARIITPDRPGFGLSDFQPRRTLLDYPDDIIQVMDSLGIEKFAVLGVSAGGPFAATCAYKLADRLTRTAIVSGVSGHWMGKMRLKVSRRHF